MNRYLLLFISCVAIIGCQDLKEEKEQSFKMIEQIDFSCVKIQDDFWTHRLNNHSTTTLAVCIDQIENQTGRIQNFENAAKKSGKHSGIYFDDSDVYKALEGIAYSLIDNPASDLEAKADEWIDKIASAQEPDGYINTYYTLTDLNERWTNMHMHEMYCAGHMIEAAVAYYHATGKRKLLDVSIKMTEHMMSVFGPDKRHWVPGHQEIELALVKLYNETKDERYLNFANWLIEERGHGHGVGWNNEPWESAYCQDDKPVREMTDIAGHAVRAMYLYCGMADVAALKNDTGYIEALDRLWDDVVLRKMYVTGGIGSSKHNEGFTEPYDLPNYDAYCETCASVGMVYWNSRMNQFTGDSKYIDVLERSMYNGALAGVSLKGDRFFYVNPLASFGEHHRKEWYGCACCPSQISRFLPSVGNYIYGVSNNAVWVNLYIGNEAKFNVDEGEITLKLETKYPWEGNVKLTVKSLSLPLEKEIRLRIPDWCKSYRVIVNGQTKNNLVTEKGYVVLNNKWKEGDKIELEIDMPVQIVSADPQVKENEGKRAVQRGPLVYCAEEIDNAESFEKMTFSPKTLFAETYVPSILSGIVSVTAKESGKNVTLIPYYSWDNRSAGQMKVWIDYVNN
ncbi:glycoside hydrolase family 127 protein [Massilibacteroides vaginae]|uniref:glycoside hydrolase family 127 protein n=1 Tax=Massilibacteroides vaginae TaxID=1673718 RepID=UPI000A1C8715|nr:glycoside hydrolase family 127 protein [Massilibacteroides vaginae]